MLCAVRSDISGYDRYLLDFGLDTTDSADGGGLPVNMIIGWEDIMNQFCDMDPSFDCTLVGLPIDHSVPSNYSNSSDSVTSRTGGYIILFQGRVSKLLQTQISLSSTRKAEYITLLQSLRDLIPNCEIVLKEIMMLFFDKSADFKYQMHHFKACKEVGKCPPEQCFASSSSSIQCL